MRRLPGIKSPRISYSDPDHWRGQPQCAPRVPGPRLRRRAQTSTVPVVTPSLQVVFDLAALARRHLVGVRPDLASRTAPAKQIPALVEGLLQVSQPHLLLLGRDFPGRAAGAEVLLLIDERGDPPQNLFVVHANQPFTTRPGVDQPGRKSTAHPAGSWPTNRCAGAPAGSMAPGHATPGRPSR